MNRFIKKTAKLCLFPFFLINKCVKRTNWYRNTIPNMENYPDNKWYRTHDERNFEVINLGSSSGVYAFDYSDTGVKAFNWALQPQSMEYSFKVLKNYYSILRENGIVIIPFSPFSGLSVTGKWAESSNDKYYHILDSTLIENFTKVSQRRNYPLFAHPKQALKHLIKDIPPRKGMRNCNICHSSLEFERDAEIWIRNWMKEFNISNLEAPLSEENKKGAESRKKTVQAMITFCIERNLRPILVIPPIHPALTNKLTPIFRENYIYSFLRCANVNQVPFFDYIDSPDFRDDRYFSNSYFMSEEGAKVFTQVLLKQIL